MLKAGDKGSKEKPLAHLEMVEMRQVQDILQWSLSQIQWPPPELQDGRNDRFVEMLLRRSAS